VALFGVANAQINFPYKYATHIFVGMKFSKADVAFVSVACLFTIVIICEKRKSEGAGKGEENKLA
jgi:hypothetical protein